MIKLGPHILPNGVFLAPMAGITDRPFRDLCVARGAGLAVAEMVTSNTELWESEKNRLRLITSGSVGLKVIQIAGSDPAMMARAATLNAEAGADVIDINMGCPAKKVLKKAAGSALLKDCKLVRDILQAVVGAVDIPVTLKIRTGWSPETRNGVEIAKLAQDMGIQMLSVHGRTRECRFVGAVEYDTIAAIKEAVEIPVIANGDIISPDLAHRIISHTGADGVMIGRAAQGNPWIFQETEHYLRTGKHLPARGIDEVSRTVVDHLKQIYRFYGEFKGVLFARKHVGWYVGAQPGAQEAKKEFKKAFNQLNSSSSQLDSIQTWFGCLINNKDFAA